MSNPPPSPCTFLARTLQADRANLLEWAATQFGASLTLRPAAAGLVAGQRPVAGGDPSDPLGSPEGGYRCGRVGVGLRWGDTCARV